MGAELAGDELALRELSPLWFRAITMTGGLLGLVLFYRARGTPLALPRSEALRILWLALPNIIGWHTFSILGLQELASGRAVILGFTMPVWTVGIAVLLGRERMSPRVALAAVMAVAAVGLLSAQELLALAGRPVGVVWMQLAALSWAIGTVQMRATRSTLSTEAVTIWMMAVGALFFCLVAPLAEPLPRAAAWSPVLWATLVYGVFLNYGIAQVIWFSMARDLPPLASAFSIMAVPLVGTASAAWVTGEVPRPLDALAALCVVAAIAAALLPRRARDNPSP